jgi:signal transduction histidine kinase/ActR/RegA family two-component response regulator
MQCVLDQLSAPETFTAKVAHLYGHAREESFDRVEFKDGRVFERYSRPQLIGGQVVGRVWSFRDITERQSLEEQLRQSQKMEAIGQLSGGIAHDFNNLLTAIIGHLGLLRGNPQVTPQIAESLGEISAAANRAAKLTSQLLAFSRRQVISISVLDLNEVVKNLTKMLRRVLGEQVAVELDFTREELNFQGDAGMMEQVLVNLAVNARDAMPAGGTLRITTRRESRPPPALVATGVAGAGAFVRLSVTDTGTGIPAEIRSKIFEPFFTTKGVGKGTGLGLATVFGIMQQHHGGIEVESEVGRGTTFHLYLPLLAQARADTPGLGMAPPAQPARGRGELILLVEDEVAVQQIVQQALRRFGYRVLLAGNGPAALKVWAEHKEEIALLLTDLIMPEGISGLQLARQLLEEKPRLRVVYSSGYSAEIAGKEMKLTDGVNYLAKPYELDQLFRTVRVALDRAQSRSPF